MHVKDVKDIPSHARDTKRESTTTSHARARIRASAHHILHIHNIIKK